jgi:HEPN domain-containing protein
MGEKPGGPRAQREQHKPQGRATFVVHSGRIEGMDRSADWLKQAENDLRAAEDSAKTGHHEWAAFQAQQSAEKAAKALVQSLHGAVRGHAIAEILRRLPSSLQVPNPVLDAALALDRVYVAPRYPNAFPSGHPADYFNERSSREYIDYARQVLEFCRSQIH